METLVNLQINFALMQMLTSDETAGLIGSHCIRLCKFMPCMFRNMDRHITKKNHNSTNAENTIQK